MRIENSVGRLGINARADVEVVQRCLNRVSFQPRLAKLGEDGKLGPMTQAAIERFQREIVRMARPDGRIDPNGRSMKVLVAHGQPAVKGPSAISVHGVSAAKVVQYRADAQQVLSHYSKSVIKHLMLLTGVDRVDISSTWRTPEKQAEIMYGDNLAAVNQGVSLYSIRKYNYAKAGQAVDKIFSDNYGKKTKAQILELMVDEIQTRSDTGERVSLHCVSWEEYQRNNIFDIPYSSVPRHLAESFEDALLAYAEGFRGRHFTKNNTNLHSSAMRPIHRVIVERRCWHIEIPQANQLLPVLP